MTNNEKYWEFLEQSLSALKFSNADLLEAGGGGESLRHFATAVKNPTHLLFNPRDAKETSKTGLFSLGFGCDFRPCFVLL